MGKTPDEIKKGLACCADASPGACGRCPYVNDCEDFGACKLPRDALAYINQLEARVPKWISVKDRLPESYETVIISREDCHEACIGWLIDGSWSVPKGVHVTHWMQLPELPKEELTHEAKRFFRNRARKSENMAVL